MAERSLLQYTPVQGPVWREPVAEKMQWLPEGQQPARTLLPNSLGSYARPEFAALYAPAGLQWTPSDRYAGRAQPYSITRWYVLDPIPPEDPKRLEWQPRDYYTGRTLPRALLDWSVYPLQPPVAPYDPQGLEWQARDSYFGQLLKGTLRDLSIYPLQPPVGYDPQNLEWLPRGMAPQVPIEFRRVGDFVQPAFSALYDPRTMEWVLQGQQPQRIIQFVYTGNWITDPFPLPDATPPNRHKLYYDVSSGRLFWQISVTSNPILIEPI